LPRDVHPFYTGTQAHPELKSRPTRAHPLFRAFVGAALEYNAAERLPVEIPDARAEPRRPSHSGADRGVESVRVTA
jgi:CTP synthase